MKRIFKIAAIAALSCLIFSCQKEETSDPGQSIEDQYAYMDAAGEEALSQITVSDFQRLADLVNSLPSETPDFEIDEKCTAKLLVLISELLEPSALNPKSCVIDFTKITGTFTIKGNVISYDTGSGRNVVYVTDNNTWTAAFSGVKSGTKKVKLGEYEIELLKKTLDIYLVVPAAFTVNVSDNTGVYMGGTAENINCDSMPDDWTALEAEQISCSFSGNSFINGKGSYRAEATKCSVSNLKFTLEGGAIYGNKSQFLASGNGSATLVAAGEDEYEIDFKSLSFYGNLLNKVYTKNNSSATAADIYFSETGTAQLSIAYETGDVTFADGTKKSFEEVFNETNFPKSYSSAVSKLMQFIILFGIDQ